MPGQEIWRCAFEITATFKINAYFFMRNYINEIAVPDFVRAKVTKDKKFQ